MQKTHNSYQINDQVLFFKFDFSNWSNTVRKVLTEKSKIQEQVKIKLKAFMCTKPAWLFTSIMCEQSIYSSVHLQKTVLIKNARLA